MFFFFTNLITAFPFFKWSLFVIPAAFVVAVIFPIDVKDIIFVTVVIVIINVSGRYELTYFFYDFIRFNKRSKFANKFLKFNNKFEKGVLKLKNKPAYFSYNDN